VACLLTAFFVFYSLGVIFVLGVFYLAPRPPGFGWPHKARRLRSFFFECLAAWPTQLLLAPMALFWPPWWHKGQGRPILLLHGYGQTRGDFWLLAWRLRRRLGRPLFAVDYSFFALPEDCAGPVQRSIDRICSQTGQDSIDMICHSYGGIVARHVIERKGCRKVRRLFFVATPHNGTWWANLGPGPSSPAMQPASQYLVELGPPHPPEETTYLAAWSLADAVVSPPDSASILGAGPQKVVDDLGHLSLLFSPRITDWIIQGLCEQKYDGEDCQGQDMHLS